MTLENKYILPESECVTFVAESNGCIVFCKKFLVGKGGAENQIALFI